MNILWQKSFPISELESIISWKRVKICTFYSHFVWTPSLLYSTVQCIALISEFMAHSMHIIDDDSYTRLEPPPPLRHFSDAGNSCYLPSTKANMGRNICTYHHRSAHWRYRTHILGDALLWHWVLKVFLPAVTSSSTLQRQMPKIWNKCSQKRNIGASVPISNLLSSFDLKCLRIEKALLMSHVSWTFC